MSRSPLAVIGVVLASLVALAGLLFFAVDSLDRIGSGSDSSSGYASDSRSAGDIRRMDDALPFVVGDDGELGATGGGIAPDETARDLWGLFRSVAGDRAGDVATFAVYSDPDDTSQASVWRDEDDPLRWDADVNAAWADDRYELEHTMIHEFGHILSLSDDQVSAISGSCPTFELSEGCAGRDSLIAAFQKRFWAPIDDDAPGEGADGVADEDEVAAFFRENGGFDTFVSEYAATNVAEDIAESWAEYVLASRPGFSVSDATGESEWSAKVRFFEQYPEFVEQRERIREVLELDSPRG